MKVLRILLCVSLCFACKVIWVPNKEGLFSQFLQLRIVWHVVSDMGTTPLCIAPLVTKHLNGTPISLCSVFAVEHSELICHDQGHYAKRDNTTVARLIRAANSKALYAERYSIYKIHGIDQVDSSIVLTNGAPFIGGETRRDAILQATSFAFPPFKLAPPSSSPGTLVLRYEYKFTVVVHWRRGDQLETRCKQEKDQSVNCGTVEQLISSVRSFAVLHSSVYVAAGGALAQEERVALDAAGFRHLRSLHPSADPSSIAALVFEAQLMLEAPTFLAWGASIVNDVIEHERMLRNLSWCGSREFDNVPYPTWCWLAHQRIVRHRARHPGQRHLPDRDVLLLEDTRMRHSPLVLSQYNISAMPAYQAEVAREDQRMRALVRELGLAGT